MPKWLAYSILAILLWGFWGLLNKAPIAPLVMTVVSTPAVVAVGLALLLSKGLTRGDNLRRGMAWAFVTGVCGNLGNIAQLEALRRGGEASVVLPVTMLYPLVTVVLARLCLGERMNPVQCLGLVVALAAIYLLGLIGSGEKITVEKAVFWWRGNVSGWMLYALGTLVLWGLAAVFQKLAVTHISNELSLVCFSAAFVPTAIVILLSAGPLDWKLPAIHWVYAILYGLGIGVGTLTLFAAYRWGKASVVTALTGLFPALTVVLVLAVPAFEERFDLLKGAAILLALGAGTALTCEGKREEAAPA
jgi:uncharacterized membrane protein